MKKILLKAGLGALAVLVVAAGIIWLELRPPAPLAAAADRLLLADVTVINPGNGRQAGRSVQIADGRIQQITVAPSGVVPGEALAEYRGHYVLPGLFEMHTHLPPDIPLKLTGYYALLFLAHGVTSIREAGDVDRTAVSAYRRDVENGPYPGPRLFSCGPFFSEVNPEWESSILLTQPGQADTAVAEVAAAGAACIKAHDGLSLARLNELKTAAARHGLPVMGHVPADLSMEQALIPDAQHFFGVPLPKDVDSDAYVARMVQWQAVDEARIRDVVAVSVKHGLTHTPTLTRGRHILKYRNYAAALAQPQLAAMPRMFRDVVWNPIAGIAFYRNLSRAQLDGIEAGLEKQQRLLRALYAAGVGLHLGSDSGPFIVPGDGLWQEMREFEQAGLAPENVWALATHKAADWWGDTALGEIRENAPADLLIFREDPTQNLEALNTLAAVIAGGSLYRQTDIQAKLTEYQTHFNSRVFDAISMTAARREMRRLFSAPAPQ